LKIYALADLHLSLSHPDKDMKVFGPLWEDYHQKIKTHWLSTISDEDLVLIPGDISWAMKLESAMIDLEFIESLPGKKVLIRGNHDYWWPSLSKLEKLPFKTLTFLHNTACEFHGIGICGSRLWDSDEYSFHEFINFRENPKQREKQDLDDKKIFESELKRLELSISCLPKHVHTKIAMVHYPPIGKDLKPSKCSHIFEASGISHVCFGHLHNLKTSLIPWGQARGVTYHFCSADEVNFQPQLIMTL